jgi:hypothetical protein
MKKMRYGSRPYYWLEERVNFNRRVFSQEPSTASAGVPLHGRRCLCSNNAAASLLDVVVSLILYQTWTATKLTIKYLQQILVVMAIKQQAAVNDIVNALLDKNQALITKEEALQSLDQVFRQAREADQLLDSELNHA